MAANPVYGKQYIRFAETGLVPDNVAISQFTLVTGSGATDPMTLAVATATGEIVGVIQQDKNLATTGYATDLMREATVATSGLLLVRADSANLQAAGAALLCDGQGRSSSAGAAVTVNGTSPIVRQQVLIGGESLVLVSFN